MRMIARTLMAAIPLMLLLTSPDPAKAGPNDTPLSTFSDAQAALHVYTAVGAIKNNHLETIFICTNLHTSPVNIGVEFFDKTGTPINSITDGNGELKNIGVGATVTIGSGSTNVFTEDAILLGLPVFPPIPSLKNGSARVVATSKSISCTAMLVDDIHAIEDPLISTEPPPTIVNLPLIRIP